MIPESDLQLVNEAAYSLRSKSLWKKDLTSSEIDDLIREVISSVLSNQSSVRAHVLELKTNLIGCASTGRAEVSSKVRVEKPIGATLHINFSFANHPSRKDLVVLEQCSVSENPDNFVSRLALNAVNIKSKVNSILEDPTQALKNVLAKKLHKLSIKLEECGCRITPDSKFRICLAGSHFQ